MKTKHTEALIDARQELRWMRRTTETLLKRVNSRIRRINRALKSKDPRPGIGKWDRAEARRLGL